jgi:hypothetical protein
MGRVAPPVRKARARSVHETDVRSRNTDAGTPALRDRMRRVRGEVGTRGVHKRARKGSHLKVRDQRASSSKPVGSTKDPIERVFLRTSDAFKTGPSVLADAQDKHRHPVASQTRVREMQPGNDQPVTRPELEKASEEYALAVIQSRIAVECDAIKEMLLEKNRRYGSSFSDPLRIFAKGLSPEAMLNVRIDDKLSRLSRGSGKENEDVVQDLIGYLVLLRVLQKS